MIRIERRHVRLVSAIGHYVRMREHRLETGELPTAEQMLKIIEQLGLKGSVEFAVKGGAYSYAGGFRACAPLDDMPRYYLTHKALGRPDLPEMKHRDVNGVCYWVGSRDVHPGPYTPKGLRFATYVEMRRYAACANEDATYIYAGQHAWGEHPTGRALFLRDSAPVEPATTYTKVGATLRSDAKAPYWEGPEPETELVTLERLLSLDIRPKRGIYLYTDGKSRMLIDLTTGRKWRPSERLNTKAWLVFGFTS